VCLLGIVPSSTRSSSTAASPLPSQFTPLLGDTVEKVREVIRRVMPLDKKLSALEEAEFEDEGGEEGALEREMLSQGYLLLLTFCSVICNTHGLSYSDANPSSIQAPRGHMRAHRNGSTICRRCCAA
jgi:hypothetical protein